MDRSSTFALVKRVKFCEKKTNSRVKLILINMAMPGIELR
jgi:hypothetical protein